MPGMSPAFFFVQQVEAWQFEAFFALVIITNSVFIGVAQLQPTTVGTGSGPTPVGLGWLRWRLDVGCPEVTIQLESLEDSVYDAWPRPRASPVAVGREWGLEHFFFTSGKIRCVKCWGVMGIMDVSQLTFIVFKQSCLALATLPKRDYFFSLDEYVTLFVPSSTVFFGFGIETCQDVCMSFTCRRFHPTDGWYANNALFRTKAVQWSILKDPIYWICSFIENLYRLMQNPPKPAVNLGLLSP